MENVIDKIEDAKVWNYVAIGSGIFFVGGLIWMIKEIYETKQAELVAIKSQTQAIQAASEAGIEIVSEKESFSGCSGCSSSATGVKTKEKPQHDFYSSDFSGLSYREKLSPNPVLVPVHPRQSCGNGGTLHWNGWGGKVCVGAKQVS